MQYDTAFYSYITIMLFVAMLLIGLAVKVKMTEMSSNNLISLLLSRIGIRRKK